MSAPIPFDDTLTLPAANLARSNHALWAEFMVVLRRHADNRRNELVTAHSDELQKAQGRAQEAVRLVALLENAVTAADRRSTKAAP